MNSVFIRPKYPFPGKTEQDLAIQTSAGRVTLKMMLSFSWLTLNYMKSSLGFKGKLPLLIIIRSIFFALC